MASPADDGSGQGGGNGNNRSGFSGGGGLGKAGLGTGGGGGGLGQGTGGGGGSGTGTGNSSGISTTTSSGLSTFSGSHSSFGTTNTSSGHQLPQVSTYDIFFPQKSPCITDDKSMDWNAINAAAADDEYKWNFHPVNPGERLDNDNKARCDKRDQYINRVFPNGIPTIVNEQQRQLLAAAPRLNAPPPELHPYAPWEASNGNFVMITDKAFHALGIDEQREYQELYYKFMQAKFERNQKRLYGIYKQRRASTTSGSQHSPAGGSFQSGSSFPSQRPYGAQEPQRFKDNSGHSQYESHQYGSQWQDQSQGYDTSRGFSDSTFPAESYGSHTDWHSPSRSGTPSNFSSSAYPHHDANDANSQHSSSQQISHSQTVNSKGYNSQNSNYPVGTIDLPQRTKNSRSKHNNKHQKDRRKGKKGSGAPSSNYGQGNSHTRYKKYENNTFDDDRRELERLQKVISDDGKQGNKYMMQIEGLLTKSDKKENWEMVVRLQKEMTAVDNRKIAAQEQRDIIISRLRTIHGWDPVSKSYIKGGKGTPTGVFSGIGAGSSAQGGSEGTTTGGFSFGKSLESKESQGVSANDDMLQLSPAEVSKQVKDIGNNGFIRISTGKQYTQVGPGIFLISNKLYNSSGSGVNPAYSPPRPSHSSSTKSLASSQDLRNRSPSQDIRNQGQKAVDRQALMEMKQEEMRQLGQYNNMNSRPLSFGYQPQASNSWASKAQKKQSYPRGNVNYHGKIRTVDVRIGGTVFKLGPDIPTSSNIPQGSVGNQFGNTEFRCQQLHSSNENDKDGLILYGFAYGTNPGNVHTGWDAIGNSPGILAISLQNSRYKVPTTGSGGQCYDCGWFGHYRGLCPASAMLKEGRRKRWRTRPAPPALAAATSSTSLSMVQSSDRAGADTGSGRRWAGSRSTIAEYRKSTYAIIRWSVENGFPVASTVKYFKQMNRYNEPVMEVRIPDIRDSDLISTGGSAVLMEIADTLAEHSFIWTIFSYSMIGSTAQWKVMRDNRGTSSNSRKIFCAIYYLSMKKLRDFVDMEIKLADMPDEACKELLGGDRVVYKLIELINLVKDNKEVKELMMRIFGSDDIIFYDSLQGHMTEFYCERKRMRGMEHDYAKDVLEDYLVQRYRLTDYDIKIRRVLKDRQETDGLCVCLSTSTILSDLRFQEDYNEETCVVLIQSRNQYLRMTLWGHRPKEQYKPPPTVLQRYSQDYQPNSKLIMKVTIDSNGQKKLSLGQVPWGDNEVSRSSISIEPSGHKQSKLLAIAYGKSGHMDDSLALKQASNAMDTDDEDDDMKANQELIDRLQARFSEKIVKKDNHSFSIIPKEYPQVQSSPSKSKSQGREILQNLLLEQEKIDMVFNESQKQHYDPAVLYDNEDKSKTPRKSNSFRAFQPGVGFERQGGLDGARWYQAAQRYAWDTSSKQSLCWVWGCCWMVNGQGKLCSKHKEVFEVNPRFYLRLPKDNADAKWMVAQVYAVEDWRKGKRKKLMKFNVWNHATKAQKNRLLGIMNIKKPSLNRSPMNLPSGSNSEEKTCDNKSSGTGSPDNIPLGGSGSRNSTEAASSNSNSPGAGAGNSSGTNPMQQPQGSTLSSSGPLSMSINVDTQSISPRSSSAPLQSGSNSPGNINTPSTTSSIPPGPVIPPAYSSGPSVISPNVPDPSMALEDEAQLKRIQAEAAALMGSGEGDNSGSNEAPPTATDEEYHTPEETDLYPDAKDEEVTLPGHTPGFNMGSMRNEEHTMASSRASSSMGSSSTTDSTSLIQLGNTDTDNNASDRPDLERTASGASITSGDGDDNGDGNDNASSTPKVRRKHKRRNRRKRNRSQATGGKGFGGTPPQHKAVLEQRSWYRIPLQHQVLIQDVV